MDRPLRIVEPDLNDPGVENWPDWNEEEQFDGRMPLVYDRPNSTVYLGGPDWTHAQTELHHKLPQYNDHMHGYIGGGRYWGSGALTWYGNARVAPEEHQAIGNAVDQLFPGIQTQHQPADPDDWTDDI